MMKPRLLLRIFSVYILLCVSYAVNPATTDTCLAFESTYHLDRACECVTYQSYGRSQGTFTSPNFPLVYPPNINCILYTFIGDLDEIVELTFLEFDLKVPVTNKCTDFLRFFLDIQRPEVNEATIWQYELCGNISMIQKKHYSSGRSLILEFHTDSFQGNHTGYRGIFRFLDKKLFNIVGGNRRWGTQCTYDFYSNKTPKEGQFFSPRFPQNYPPNANCQYVFYGMEGERVKILFKNLQLETIDGSCSSSPDTILVRDGVDATAPVIAQYCNTRNGELIISSGENMYIEFLVDSRKQRQGFAATFQFIKDELPEPPKSTRRPQTRIFPGPNTHSPGDSPGGVGPTVPTTKMITTECVNEYSSSTAMNGSFNSPDFPETYPGSMVCRYVFQGKGRERVQIMFTALDMHYPSGDPKSPYDCEDVDSVTVGVFIDGQPSDLGVYCGNKRPPMLMSNDNRLEVVFHSVGPGNGAKGFKADYKFVTDFGIKNGKQNTDMVCSFIFRSEQIPNGTFTSPNFPGLYPKNTECHYLFYGRTNERIHITFPYFDVEGIPPACTEDTQSDFVEFSNFNIKLKDRKMNRFCGTREDDQKKEVKSDGNFFRVTFKSNNVYDATGFEAFYQFRKYEDPFIPPNKRVEHNRGTSHVITASLPAMLLLLVLLLSS